jgi:dihydrolipoamide dehydrogenase
VSQHDLVVIGAGPGGYVAAIRAAQLGLNVACIEKEAALGGTCLRIGCIPSKALLESSHLYWETTKSLKAHGIKVGSVEFDLSTMMKRKESVVRGLTGGINSLFKKNNVTRYQGHGRIAGPGKVVVESESGTTELQAGKILIATGSKSAPLRGVEVDGDRIGTSTEALSYSSVPGHLVVIGAGAIGLELGSVWRRLGAKVTVLEYLDRILPGMDLELAGEAQKVLEKQGIVFRLGSRVTSARVENEECVVECDGAEPVRCDRVLLAVGRIPNTDNLGLETVGIEKDPRGRIPVDDHFATTANGVYAIGDVIRGAMLAHKAEEEGMACVETIVKGHGHVDYNSIPGVVYTHPEIASVGKTEEDLLKENIPYRKGIFPFIANGRARSMADTEGKVKMLAHAETDRILGVHIIGPRAGDLIAEAAVAIAFGSSSEDLALASHAHPTLAECLKEAALAVDGRPIHI